MKPALEPALPRAALNHAQLWRAGLVCTQDLVLQLVRDTPALVAKLLAFRELLPTLDLSSVLAAHPQLLLKMDPPALEAQLGELRWGGRLPDGVHLFFGCAPRAGLRALRLEAVATLASPASRRRLPLPPTGQHCLGWTWSV